MTTFLMLLLVAWGAWMLARWVTYPRQTSLSAPSETAAAEQAARYHRTRIAALERLYYHARSVGDVAKADQIEAMLRDTPGSGWGSRQG